MLDISVKFVKSRGQNPSWSAEVGLYVLALVFAFTGCGRSSMEDAATNRPADALNRDAGACLLFYNEALVEGDPCCYREGSLNTCDTSIPCNTRSGGGCCLIYASERTGLGQTCCLHENSFPYGNADDPKECQQLLSQSRK